MTWGGATCQLTWRQVTCTATVAGHGGREVEMTKCWDFSNGLMKGRIMSLRVRKKEFHFWANFSIFGILENRQNWKNSGIFQYADVSMTWGGHMTVDVVASDV